MTEIPTYITHGWGVLLVDIGFLNFGLLDILDIAIVSYLFYRVYKLLRGSVAFNIFLGLVTLYLVWWLVNALNMQLLATILSQFAGVGVILLIIVFQPEIRSFLLELGQTTFGNRLEPLKGWLNIRTEEPVKPKIPVGELILDAVKALREAGDDAVLILNSGTKDSLGMTSATELNADFNKDLLLSIQRSSGELKNGAVVIEGGKIKAIGAKFPYSESESLPEQSSIKHRLGAGATEVADVGAIVISGHDKSVSTAYQGYLAYDIPDSELKRFIKAHT